jgi:hypothetical protein
VTQRGVCAFVLILASGCGAPGPAALPAPAMSAAPAAPAQMTGLPLLEPGAPDPPSPLSDDPLWQRALAGDPIDLQRLADREGAAGLLAGVAAGRDLGLTALLALPRAEDGELALERLCTLAVRLDGAGRSAVLAATHGVASAMPVDRERMAAEMLRPCAEKLGRLAADRRVAPADRDLAESARDALGRLIRPETPP